MTALPSDGGHEEDHWGNQLHCDRDSTWVLLTVPFVSERDLNREIRPLKRAIGS
jgi:hypothetical protein